MKIENITTKKYFVLVAAILAIPLISCNKAEAPGTPPAAQSSQAPAAEANAPVAAPTPAPTTEPAPAASSVPADQPGEPK